jgi:pseudaminic acid synthase
MPPSFAIAGRTIGPGHPPYIIAEMSANHNQDIDRALAILDAAAAAGVDAVKLQTYTPDTITIDHDGPGFRIESGLWKGKTLYHLYREAHMPWAWHERLFARGAELGIAVFSSPFDEAAVDLLESLDAPAYKIASFEVIDHPLIERAARTGKPLIMSTGMATLSEIGDAVEVARAAGAQDIVLLHCISAYPAPAAAAHLATIPDLAGRFGVAVGLSDHTLGTAVAVAATALGATVIEKHFTLRRADGGADSAFSLEPHELDTLVRDCRTAFEATGAPSYELEESERQSFEYRRSLYAIADIAAGETLTAKNIRSIRPGYGLPPKEYRKILQRRAKRAIARGTPLGWELIE